MGEIVTKECVSTPSVNECKNNIDILKKDLEKIKREDILKNLSNYNAQIFYKESFEKEKNNIFDFFKNEKYSKYDILNKIKNCIKSDKHFQNKIKNYFIHMCAFDAGNQEKYSISSSKIQDKTSKKILDLYEKKGKKDEFLKNVNSYYNEFMDNSEIYYDNDGGLKLMFEDDSIDI